MSKIKKMPKQFLNEVDRIGDLMDRYEMLGLKVIRIKQRARLETSPEKSEMDSVRGFDVFGKTDRGFEISVGQTMMYPCVDGHRYGYIPATPHNLSKLKHVVGSKDIIIDDEEFIDYAIEEARKHGLPTEYVQKVNDFGDMLNKDEARKKHRIRMLEKQLEQKLLDQKIAELEAELAGEATEDEIKKEEPEQVAPKVKPLAGKSIPK